MSAVSNLTRELLGVALTNTRSGNEVADNIDKTANVTQAQVDAVALPSARNVVSTDATLAITAALHEGKTVILDSTHTQTLTLPAATGSGNRFSFVVGTKGTDGSKVIKVANTADIIQGVSLVAQSDATQINGFQTTATDDTITLNNSTKGGFVGDKVTIQDIKSGVFQVNVVGFASGTVVTPFSASV
jgi:hypothetical protein